MNRKKLITRQYYLMLCNLKNEINITRYFLSLGGSEGGGGGKMGGLRINLAKRGQKKMGGLCKDAEFVNQ